MPAIQPQSTTDRRRSLLGMAGFIVVLLIANGAAGWLGLKYTALANERGQELLAAVSAAGIGTREAQVDFKVQVQEWKNVLIRGHDPEDRTQYWTAFEARETMVAERLAQLIPAAGLIGSSREHLEALQGNHRALGIAYREALGSFQPQTDPASFRQADAAVRGQDRALADALDALADQTQRESTRISSELEQAAQRRAQRLQTFTLATTLGTILLLFGMVFLSARKD
jgi:hypothetical protein